MEQRAFLAVVLMAAVLIIYQSFLVPSQETPAPAPPKQEHAAPPPSQPPAVTTGTPAPAPSPIQVPPPTAPEASAPQRITRVMTPLYDAAVSSEGGKLQELMLRYRGQKPMVSVGELGPTGLVIARPGAPSGQVVSMQPSTDALRVGPDQPKQEVVLTGSHDGLRVREALTFGADTYAIEARVRVENTTATAQSVTVALPWTTRQDWREGKAKEKFQGQHPTEIVWATNGGVARIENLCQVPAVSVPGRWIGMGSVWYMGALIPRTEGFTLVASGEDKACDSKSKEPVGRATIAAQASPTIAPGQAWEGHVTIFLGPKEYERLKALGLEQAINFGGFPVPRNWGGLPMEWFGVPILILMNWVYHHVGNYGIAIILLTIVSKVLFYPLTVKGMRSMKAMQALQPQINALRNKHKSDPQRLQRETMDLYRQHKVNPMGGCLPMVAQVPIFYALYLALSVSVELQNAAFLCLGRVPPWVPLLGGTDLWICDLANHDPTYVLPILMGVTMFVQQKMTPIAGDPRQAKMMLVMPFIFTFMFLNLPSGLVLYWTVSNVLQVLQQWYMDRPKARAGREARDPSRS
ncbi:MAG TPA: membrane protein insertase YidC [Methylomirabilota bacterium]|nr:membrane protein insertase YidC [Methylomirabilota bacterium]